MGKTLGEIGVTSKPSAFLYIPVEELRHVPSMIRLPHHIAGYDHSRAISFMLQLLTRVDWFAVT